MFENPFLFYLIDPATGNYWTMVSGVPTLTATPTPLTDFYFGDPQAPAGWKDIKFSWARSSLYWGLYRNMSTNFTFHSDAAEILTYLLYSVGSTAQCTLQIRQWDMANSGSPTVSLNIFYSGDLDFVKCVPTKGAVEIPVKEQGLRDLFTQNERVTYEIPITAPDSVLCSLYGMRMLNTKRFLTEGSWDLNINTNTPFLITLISEDGSYQNAVTQTVDPSSFGNLDRADVFFTATLTQFVTISYDMIIAWTVGSGVPTTDLFFSFIVFPDDTFSSPILVHNINSVTGIAIYPSADLGTQFINNFSLTLNPGNVIVLNLSAVDGSGTISDVGTVTVTNGMVRIDADFSLPLTQTQALTEATVLNKIVDAMTDGAYPADDTFLATNADYVDSSPALTVYASGDAIRNISAVTGDPDVLKITPGDFFQNIMNDYGGGIGIENDTVIFRKKDYFLNPSYEIMDIGEVGEFSAPVAEDLINNYIQVGCSEQEYDGYNGKDEFMNTFKWKTVITNPQTLDLIRKFRYDPYGIETTRYTLLFKDTTDNKGDNDIYVWEIDNLTIVSGGYAPRRFPVPPNIIGGVLFPESKYNIGKSPLHQFWRNAPQVKGMLYYNMTDRVVFQSTEKNSKLYSQISGVDYIEKDPIVPNANFGTEDPLFIPNWLKFTCPLGAQIITALNANPNGYISFSVKGIALKGFPWNVDVNGQRTQKNEVTLLCHPAVDPMDIREAVKRSSL